MGLCWASGQGSGSGRVGQALGGILHHVPGSSRPPEGVCVAGYGQSGGNEILQLLPPPTLQLKETQVGAAARVAPETSVLLGPLSLG